jgi:hypothetical protein
VTWLKEFKLRQFMGFQFYLSSFNGDAANLLLMLTLMTDLPENVVGVTADGTVTGSDYEKVLMPAVENRLKTQAKLRMIYHLGQTFKGFDTAAMVDDAKLGMKHWSTWERIALVSDHPIINSFAKFFRHLVSCEIQVFRETDLQRAKHWIIQ